MDNMTALIMAGGKGERFWPKSREASPKQLLPLLGQETMIQATVKRLQGLVSPEKIYIVTSGLYTDAIREQLPQVPPENIIVEPVGRNTAPSIGLATLHMEKKFPDATCIVLPADHLIKDKERFHEVLQAGVAWAGKEDAIITLGIKPDRPETGYGYIECGETAGRTGSIIINRVCRFVEKPDRKTAEEYYQSARFLWNSGMFIWRLSHIRKSIEVLLPSIHRALEAIGNSLDTGDYQKVLGREFLSMESISIDYGVMERSKRIFVLPGDFGWDDVGSWPSLERVGDLDNDGNLMQGKIVSLDTTGCIVQGKEKLIAMVGVEDLVIVDTEDVTLVCSKDKAQNLKALLNKLREQKLENYL